MRHPTNCDLTNNLKIFTVNCRINDANFLLYPIRCCVTQASAIECLSFCIVRKQVENIYCKHGDSNCEVIICFCTKFKVLVDLAFIESDTCISFGHIPYVTVINDLWNSRIHLNIATPLILTILNIKLKKLISLLD